MNTPVAYPGPMELRVPSGGSIFDVFGADALSSVSGVGTDAAIAAVTPAQLDDALGALERGAIEYVVLADDPTFVQVAGSGSGPYQLEYNPGQVEHQVRVPEGVGISDVHLVLHAYLAGNPAWAQSFTWQSAGLGDTPATGGGFLKKLFGKR